MALEAGPSAQPPATGLLMEGDMVGVSMPALVGTLGLIVYCVGFDLVHVPLAAPLPANVWRLWQAVPAF
jgi:hypothetical protein